MAKSKLFAKPVTNDKQDTHERFSELARKVVTTPKSKVDEREKAWRRSKA